MDKVKDFVISNKMWLIVEIVGITVGFFVGSSVTSLEDEELTFDDVQAVEYEEEPICEIFTDISGAVNVPGVYCLSSISILDDLILEAGGFTKDVCQKWVSRELNRAQMLENGMKLYIPSENEEECSVDLGSQPIQENTRKVSINKGSQSEIETLSGIGPSIAKTIIDGRPYSELEALLDVKGIGNVIFDKIRDDIVL